MPFDRLLRRLRLHQSLDRQIQLLGRLPANTLGGVARYRTRRTFGVRHQILRLHDAETLKAWRERFLADREKPNGPTRGSWCRVGMSGRAADEILRPSTCPKTGRRQRSGASAASTAAVKLCSYRCDPATAEAFTGNIRVMTNRLISCLISCTVMFHLSLPIISQFAKRSPPLQRRLFASEG